MIAEALLAAALACCTAVPWDVKTVIVTVYTPNSGHSQNGGRVAANGSIVVDGHAACGYAYKFGDVVEIVGPARERLIAHGISTRVVCVDRGHLAYNQIDIALVNGTDADKARRAYGFGLWRGATAYTIMPAVPGMRYHADWRCSHGMTQHCEVYPAPPAADFSPADYLTELHPWSDQ